MIKSMTGFGQARASSDGISLQVECKSVNNRYLDLTLRLPAVLKKKELTLKDLIQDYIERGSINLKVTIHKKETGNPEYTVNKNLAKAYKSLLEELRQTANIESPVTLQDLTQFDDVFSARQEDEETVKLLWSLTREAAEKALEEMLAMRAQEGEQLKCDMMERVDHIERMMQKIEALTQDRSKELHQQLRTKIDNIIENDQINDERLEAEVAILVDKMDITEEVVRLKSHIKFFREALEADNENGVGRRLKFLSQEMNREINTMGSKANHSKVSQLVVQAKESLEQIREQILNVE